MWIIRRAPNNGSKRQVGSNVPFERLNDILTASTILTQVILSNKQICVFHIILTVKSKCFKCLKMNLTIKKLFFKAKAIGYLLEWMVTFFLSGKVR